MSFKELLSETFLKEDKAAWQKIASSEINGADPFQTLAWQTPDALTFLPYYDKTDISAIQGFDNFHFSGSSVSEAREWKTIASVTVVNESTANRMALDHLKHEADGVIFYLKNKDVDFNPLLEKIEWSHCTVSFVVADTLSAEAFSYYIQKRYKDDSLTGCLFWINPQSVTNVSPSISSIKNFGIFVQSSTPVQEIVYALKQAVQLIYRMQESGLATSDIVNNIAFSVPSGHQFLLEIAKLKALRMLWYQVTQAFSVNGYQPANLYIHTRSQPWTEEAYQPHANMLSNTVSSLAAIIGGCNAHTIHAEDEKDQMLIRIARNNSFLIRDEAHVGKVADTLAGSYAIEHMTNELAKSAWEKFQNQLE